ncbi:MAG: cysteine synthase A [Desulfovibrio sp.]|jgi:cysteine synthase A|nr:cysteine synthase A [Desulfovibrio sp.]
MPKTFDDNPSSIGNTPLVRLNKISGPKATILAKIEGRNPSYSSKDRIGAAMIWDAEKRGLLKPGMTIVEPTSGNTGISLAFVAAARGYGLTLTMPATMSVERRKVAAMLGANIILTPNEEGMTGAIRAAEELAGSEPGRFYIPQQFTNPANPAIHEKTTGPEIWNDTGGVVDALVAGIGTGGTLTGIARYFKRRRRRQVTCVAVEPLSSPVLTQHLAGKPLAPGHHLIQGLGAGFIPKTLDVSLVDRVITASNEESVEYAVRLAREEGILAGISSGAAMAAADRLSREPAFEGKTIVVILPDAGERYLSTPLYKDV